jgi:hypothetical protein
MPQVAAAALAANLDANHSVADVANLSDVLRIERLIETRPPSTGFKLGPGSEQGKSAQPAAVNTLLLIGEQPAAKRRLGAVVQQNPPFFST